MSAAILFAIFLAFGNAFAQETVKEAQSKPDDPVIRVRSEIIHRRDIMLPVEMRQYQKSMSAQEIANWQKSYQMEVTFSFLNEKMEKAFCEKADCKPSAKEIADWKIFLKKEAILGGPPDSWKTNKVLFEQGRIHQGNLGGPYPIEAHLRLLHEMEDRGDLQFYDPEIRAEVMEYFNRFMEGASDPKDNVISREKGKGK